MTQPRAQTPLVTLARIMIGSSYRNVDSLLAPLADPDHQDFIDPSNPNRIAEIAERLNAEVFYYSAKQFGFQLLDPTLLPCSASEPPAACGALLQSVVSNPAEPLSHLGASLLGAFRMTVLRRDKFGLERFTPADLAALQNEQPA